MNAYVWNILFNIKSHRRKLPVHLHWNVSNHYCKCNEFHDDWPLASLPLLCYSVISIFQLIFRTISLWQAFRYLAMRWTHQMRRMVFTKTMCLNYSLKTMFISSEQKVNTPLKGNVCTIMNRKRDYNLCFNCLCLKFFVTRVRIFSFSKCELKWKQMLALYY